MDPQHRMDAKRNYYPCEVCHIVTCNIATHLKRKCMKGKPKEEIDAALVKARERVFIHIRDHLVITYSFIKDRLSLDRDGISEVLELLEELGHTVTNKPSTELAKDDCPSTHRVLKNVESISHQLMHSVTDSYLGEFAQYLLKNVTVKESWEMTGNVSRLLYFANSSSIDLHSLQPDTIQKFFLALKESGLSSQTRMTYLKCIKQFTGWLIKLPGIKSEGDSLIANIQSVDDWLAVWSRQGLGDGPVRPRKSVEECQVLLRVAANDFKTAMRQNGDIHPSDYILVLSYLTALLSLKHLQRRSVIENFKVEEWATGIELKLDDERFWTFYVKESQVDGQETNTQPAAFCLNEEEHMWFQIYFDQFRPAYADKKDAHTEFFFLSTMGKKINNAANNLNRLHRKYKLGVNTAGEARRAMVTFVKSRLEGADLDLAENYLSHCANGDSTFSQLSQPISACCAMLLMTGETSGSFRTRKKSGSSMVHSSEKPVSCKAGQTLVTPGVSARNIPAAHYATTNGDLSKAFDKLTEVYPVTLDGKPPSKTLAAEFFMIKPKSIIDKWAYAQKALRVQHIKDLYPRRRPRRTEVLKFVQERKWPISLLMRVMQKWTPTSTRQTAAQITTLQERIEQQNWPGLCTGRNQRGNVIFTGKAFSKGEIIVDYHGEVMSFKEGLKRQNAVKKDGYIFFLRHKDLAIDASEEHCKCHPNTTLYGRLISHSRKGKRMNVKPETLTVDGKVCIVFRALRDLKAGEELFFDYGVRRKQFNEGHDLSWIDS